MEVLTTSLSILLLVIMVWFVLVQIINIRKRYLKRKEYDKQHKKVNQNEEDKEIKS